MRYRKIVLIVLPLIITFVLFFVPMFAIMGAILHPFEMIKDMVANIGNFFVPDDEYTNDVFVTIDFYFNYGEGYELLASDYRHIIVAHEDLIYVPDNYLFVPNILSGIEHPGDELLEAMHAKAYDTWIEKHYLYDENGEPLLDEETGEWLYEEELKAKLISIPEYAQRIMNMSPFSETLVNLSSATLVNYINHCGYIAGEPGLGQEYVLSHSVNGWIYPFTSKHGINAGLGWYDPFGTGRTWHNGVDFGASCGTAIYSASTGTVVGCGSNSSKGNYVEIASSDGLVAHYYHMESRYVGNIGDSVPAGSYLGRVGTTGRSTGCHLHLGVDEGGNYIDYCSIVDCNNPPLP